MKWKANLDEGPDEVKLKYEVEQPPPTSIQDLGELDGYAE